MSKITTLEGLEALYGTPVEAAVGKETPSLTPAYRRWIEQAPFLAIASVGEQGLDVSPRGDSKGQLLHVLDDRHLLLPDRRGNNRLDTLRNIVRDPRVSLLFLIPGIEECLRVRGRATVMADPELVQRFEMGGKLPTTVICVEIDSVFFQCARAVKRAGLWDSAGKVQKSAVPTAGQMLGEAISDFDGESYDASLEARQKATLY